MSGFEEFIKALRERVLVLDGAMGTMIQRYRLTEVDFRGERFKDSAAVLRGCNDLLCLTRPDIISDIHRQYIAAGADIIETNSFNANALSLAEYGLSGYVPEINAAAAKLARRAADEAGRRVFVAGSIGPSSVSLSMPSDGPGAVDFDRMTAAYRSQATALVAGGVDVILLETIFDTLNAKAAIYGIKQAFDDCAKELPLMLSVTLTESGRMLSGQDIDAFVASTLHAGAVSVGLNCGFGAEGMAPYVEALQKYGFPVSLHPNAGLPDEMGQYTQTPAIMAHTLKSYLEKGRLNIVGGCCGTTPEHIAAIAAEAKRATPRKLPDNTPDKESDTLLLSGLSALEVSPRAGFLKVGERCNVAGSKKFLRLIGEGNRAEALTIAAGQLRNGAALLDINMDDAMLDAEAEMVAFVDMLGLDGATAAAPIMVDSSRFEVVSSALKHIQGRAVVNSISLKAGEQEFMRRAREIRLLGGAVVVMAFDEQGQATTFERRKEICARAYRLLTEQCGFHGAEIIFDPNVLTIATGIPEHDRYALDFLDAVGWIKQNLTGAKVSGGVSNLSFAFRGNNALREAMHTVFLHHAIARGLDMAIVNPTTSLDVDALPVKLREAIDDVILCRRDDATSRLLDIATAMKAEQGSAPKTPPKAEAPTALTLQEMVVRGVAVELEQRLTEALEADGSAMAVIKKRLMVGMNVVGEAFAAGKMFLPQVVRSAGIMKQAIAWLTPYMEVQKETSGDIGAVGRMVLATVKGDVHDIGKNIVAVIMRCSGFEVIDLGVMVEAQTIINVARERKADIIGLSGLITPSLEEMVVVAGLMEKSGLGDIPLFVGGATTSDVHTAVKIAPEFCGTVVHTRDAAAMPDIAAAILDPERRDATIAGIKATQKELRDEYTRRQARRSDAIAELPVPGQVAEPMAAPPRCGIFDITFTPAELKDLINVKALLHVWHLSPADDAHASQRSQLMADVDSLIDRLTEQGHRIHGRIALLPAHRHGDAIIIENTDSTEVVIPTPRNAAIAPSVLADFIAPDSDHIGLFAVTVGPKIGNIIKELEQTDDYRAILLQSVADRLVEAATEALHRHTLTALWQLPDGIKGIRPAIGYPSLPDQRLVFTTDKILHYGDLGISLTENGALWPSATTTGLLLPNPSARYL